VKIFRSLSELRALLKAAEGRLAAVGKWGTDADIPLFAKVYKLRLEIDSIEARGAGIAGPVVQIPTKSISYRSLVSSPQWKLGVMDYVAERAFPSLSVMSWMASTGAGVWGYERGRQYAAWCRSKGREPLPVRVRGRVNNALVGEVKALFELGDLL
jgi:hypothetical protein